MLFICASVCYVVCLRVCVLVFALVVCNGAKGWVHWMCVSVTYYVRERIIMQRPTKKMAIAVMFLNALFITVY